MSLSLLALQPQHKVHLQQTATKDGKQKGTMVLALVPFLLISCAVLV